MDKYSDFKTLAANEILNQDYRIRIQDLGSNITIIAPHGGLDGNIIFLNSRLSEGGIFRAWNSLGYQDNTFREMCKPKKGWHLSYPAIID
ncbi:MAG: poly-gamma-glutamate hydrolase family protein [Proteobacteria bacterium]|nr:poly-gamma-glutamate hydrolase family protein [Pseudomonadota bacterium]MBU1695884.1 poly-gamma-glutamate hydrolase family protein [Pseudomonadota bacterium]